MNPSRILVADDHPLIREGIRNLLFAANQNLTIDEAKDGEETVKKYSAIMPDLLILDISMPGINGIEAAREIIGKHPEAKIIIHSMYEDESYVSECIERGVMGYVVKSETQAELQYAVKSVLEGNSYFSSRAQQLIFKKYSRNIEKKKREKEVRLTARETEIINLIAEGLTSAQIANRLFISQRTVDTHRANVMKKTGAKNSIDLIRRMQSEGIIPARQ